MQQMFYINHDGTSTAEIYGITDERLKQISTSLADAAVEITENYKNYLWQRGDKRGLHKGKILQRLFRDITDFQERIIVISLTDNLINRMVNIVGVKTALKELL